MNLYALYMIFFSCATVLGVPLLSSFQVIQIKGDTFAEWASTLGASLGPATAICTILAIIAYKFLKPLLVILQRAESENLSNEEKEESIKILRKMNFISGITLIVGYFLGNGTTIVIKVSKGILHYDFTDLFLIFGLVAIYGIVSIEYTVLCFNEVARSQIMKLRITNIENFNKRQFSKKLGLIICTGAITIGWHILCAGYGAVKNGLSLEQALPKLVYAFVLSFCISAPMCFILLRLLKARFEFTIKTIRGLRTNGDLITRINIGTFDDFGTVMTEMNKLMNSLQASFSQFIKENEIVDKGSLELKNISEKSELGINQILSKFDEMNRENSEKDKLLENTKNNIEKLSDDAEIICSSVEEQTLATLKNTKKITEMVKNISAMDSLIKDSQTIAQNLSEISRSGGSEVKKTLEIVNTVSEKSKKMFDVIKVIQSVASQTNMLAMNAAIEASHAGEAGLGFAVVADEIRSLAEDTSKSTKDIKTLITEILHSIEESDKSMNSTNMIFQKIENEIESQASIVGKIANVMNEQSEETSSILSSTNDISKKIENVSELVKKQASYSESVSKDINEIVSFSEQISQSMKESSQVINDFSQSITDVKTKAEQNHDSVISMNTELKKFKV